MINVIEWQLTRLRADVALLDDDMRLKTEGEKLCGACRMWNV